MNSLRHAVVTMNERGSFEWVIGSNATRYRYGYRLREDWAYSTTALTLPSHDGDQMGWEDLLSVVQKVKASGRPVAFVSNNRTSLATLNEATIPSRMSGEVTRMITFYQSHLKKGGVDVGLILRLLELRNSLDIVCKTMLPSYESEVLTLNYATVGSDTPFWFYFRMPEFDAIPVVKTNTSTATYAHYRLAVMLDALKRCRPLSELVSTATGSHMKKLATQVHGYVPLKVN